MSRIGRVSYIKWPLIKKQINLKEEERKLRDEHIAFQQQELHQEQSRRQIILSHEEDTKKRVAAELKGKRSTH